LKAALVLPSNWKSQHSPRVAAKPRGEKEPPAEPHDSDVASPELAATAKLEQPAEPHESFQQNSEVPQQRPSSPNKPDVPPNGPPSEDPSDGDDGDYSDAGSMHSGDRRDREWSAPNRREWPVRIRPLDTAKVIKQARQLKKLSTPGPHTWRAYGLEIQALGHCHPHLSKLVALMETEDDNDEIIGNAADGVLLLAVTHSTDGVAHEIVQEFTRLNFALDKPASGVLALRHIHGGVCEPRSTGDLWSRVHKCASEMPRRINNRDEPGASIMAYITEAKSVARTFNVIIDDAIIMAVIANNLPTEYNALKSRLSSISAVKDKLSLESFITQIRAHYTGSVMQVTREATALATYPILPENMNKRWNQARQRNEKSVATRDYSVTDKFPALQGNGGRSGGRDGTRGGRGVGRFQRGGRGGAYNTRPDTRRPDWRPRSPPPPSAGFRSPAGSHYADLPQHNSYTPNYAMMVFNNPSPSSGLGPSSDDGSVIVHENTDDLELHAPSDRIQIFHTPRRSLAGVEKAADRAKIEAMAADLVAAQHERAALLESKTQADAELAAMLSKYEAIK
jgi:hypothetical protein